MIQSFIGLRRSFSQILEQRLEFLAGGIQVLYRCLHRTTVFRDHSASFGKRPGQVRAIRIVQKIVHASQCHLHLARAIVERLKKLLRLGRKVVELCRESIEVHVGLGRQDRSRRGERGFLASRNNFQMIVSQRAQAHDLHMAIRLDRQTWFHAEGYLDARRIFRVEL